MLGLGWLEVGASLEVVVSFLDAELVEVVAWVCIADREQVEPIPDIAPMAAAVLCHSAASEVEMVA